MLGSVKEILMAIENSSWLAGKRAFERVRQSSLAVKSVSMTVWNFAATMNWTEA
jgi:hypothetical protein